MSDQDSDLAPVIEGSDYPPLLNTLVPLLILATTIAYAWSLQGVPNPEMNLLMLQPLLIGIWGLLLIVVVKDVIPSVQAYFARRRPLAAVARGWRQRLAPGTEAGAGVIVAATFLYSLFGPGDGPPVYLVSTFLYLVAVGWMIGDRAPVRLLLQSAVLTGMLYVIFGVVLGVRL